MECLCIQQRGAHLSGLRGVVAVPVQLCYQGLLPGKMLPASGSVLFGLG
jgi:hypothetical protein